MEAAIPEQAMPNWSDERRDQWVYMVKYAADVEELLKQVAHERDSDRILAIRTFAAQGGVSNIGISLEE